MRITKRQQEILDLRSKGLSHKEIAEKIGISEGTSRQIISDANARMGLGTFKALGKRTPPIKPK